MDTRVPPFLKRDGEAVLFNQSGEFLFYVPEFLFDRNFCEIVGANVMILGLMAYQIVDSKGKGGKIMPFYFPSVFYTSPYKIEKVKDLQLTKTYKNDFRVLHYKQGDRVIASTKTPEVIKNTEDFYRVFLTGKIPNIYPYDKLLDLFIDSLGLNGGSYGVNNQIIGIILAESCADPNDPEKLFRETDMKDMTDYRPIPIVEKPQHISAFTAITSQNIDTSIVNGTINKSKRYSPLERLML